MARSPLVMPSGQRFSAPGSPMRARTAAGLVMASVLLGVGSAWSPAQRDAAFRAVQIGPWRTYPALGSIDVDPYSRAILARSAHLPLAAGEGVTFRAATDSAGAALSGRCRYRLAGATLPSRGWTLTTADAQGLALTGAQASSLTDADLVTAETGLIEVALSATASAGAWLKAPAAGRFELILNFYDTPLSASVANLPASALPRIETEACG